MKPYYTDDLVTIIHADCIEAMAAMEPDSIDAICTDPPYGLEFMGKEWDRLGDRGKVSHDGPRERDGSSVFGRQRVSFYGSANRRCRACGHWEWSGSPCKCEQPDFETRQAPQARLMQDWHARWATAAYRVAKPSAYLLAFGGTRTVHRMTVALEDAGWIIRDMLVWGYASGFPKSKASLKPAWEPIVLARKPGPLRELAIDRCRIGFASDDDRADAEALQKLRTSHPGYGGGKGMPPPTQVGVNPSGRWPANIVLTDPIFDGGWEGVVGGAISRSSGEYEAIVRGERSGPASIPLDNGPQYADTGTYSRFFIIPKADRADREPVLGGLPVSREGEHLVGGKVCASCGAAVPNVTAEHCGVPVVSAVVPRSQRANVHPTVKPTDLMRHLVRLVTPTGGTVLDPFAGSGSTLVAAEKEGFAWIGIEREREYVDIIEARLNGTQRGLGLDVGAPVPPMPNTHPDLSKHSRAPSENYSGAWGGTDDEDAV